MHQVLLGLHHIRVQALLRIRVQAMVLAMVRAMRRVLLGLHHIRAWVLATCKVLRQLPRRVWALLGFQVRKWDGALRAYRIWVGGAVLHNCGRQVCYHPVGLPEG